MWVATTVPPFISILSVFANILSPVDEYLTYPAPIADEEPEVSALTIPPFMMILPLLPPLPPPIAALYAAPLASTLPPFMVIVPPVQRLLPPMAAAFGEADALMMPPFMVITPPFAISVVTSHPPIAAL